jgi:AAA domain
MNSVVTKRIDAYREARGAMPPTTVTDLQSEFGPIPKPRPIVLRHVSEIVAEQREPEWLIHKIIEAGVLAVIAGPRSTFKSFIALDWAMRMALDGHPGVILSGEGAGLDRRIAAWMNQHRESTDLADVPLLALERPLNLNSVVELDSLRLAIAALAKKPEFIVIDTFSKFSAGIDENDNSQVAAFLSGLSEAIREEFNCTVILVAHSGHSDAKRPRGASSLMSNPDAEYIVERPDMAGMTVTVTRERFKDAPAMSPLAYEAKVIDLGRLDKYGEPVTSLALVTADAPPISVKGRGRNQEKVVIALKEWLRTNPEATHISSIDMDGICKTQRLDRKRRREVLDSFVNAKILSHAVGGYSVNGEYL